jgi:multiple sugar transport system permease protein
MRKDRIIEAVWGYLFILPTVALLLVFAIWPGIVAGYYSLTRFDFISPPKFIGFKNYLDVFQDETFYEVMGNTLVLALGVPIGIIIALVLAAMLIDKRLQGATIYRSIYFLPVILPLVAIGTVWVWLLNEQYGPINKLLNTVGLESVPWLTSYEWSKIAVMLVGIWSGFGSSLVILMGGMASVSDNYHEAAKVDGATSSDIFFKITLPLMSPTIALVSIASFIGAFQVFDIAVVLTGGGPGRSSTPIAQYIYQEAFRSFNLGYASTLAVLLFVFMFALSVIQFRLSERFRTW